MEYVKRVMIEASRWNSTNLQTNLGRTYLVWTPRTADELRPRVALERPYPRSPPRGSG